MDDKSIIPIYGVELGIGAADKRCQLGAAHLKQEITKKLDFPYHWESIPLANHPETVVEKIANTCLHLARCTESAAENQKNFFVLGGDHSIAIGTWSGVASYYQQQKKHYGLIWIDAHMDAHTPKTSHSGNIHGMPVAVLLGHGDSLLTELLFKAPKVKPNHIFLIGIRSYEPEEKAFLECLGVKVYYMPEVKKRGFQEIIQEILFYFSEQNIIDYGLSIDLDGLDPKQVGAVGTAVPDGILLEDLLRGFELFKNFGHLIGVDIVEYNPALDTTQQTAAVILRLMNQLAKIFDSSSKSGTKD